jgi:transmembrane sensor
MKLRLAAAVSAVLAVAVAAGAIWPTSGAVGQASADEPAEPDIEIDDLDASGWRAEANAGHWQDAAIALDAAGPDAIADDPGDLILAADTLRLAGRAREALPLLARVIEDHGDDPRAPAAAFTLGRAQLARRQPAAAARTFATARALAPDGPLAEDALAREVEAWVSAGETDKARTRAARYLELYPRGARVAAITAVAVR